MWLHFAKRQMGVLELVQALTVEEGQKTFDADNVVLKEQLLQSCLGLVMVDEETDSVRFAHFTLEEYFSQVAVTYFPDGHLQLGQTCLTFLRFQEFKVHMETRESFYVMWKQYPFLDYAIRNWYHHIPKEYDDEVTAWIAEIFMHDHNRACFPVQCMRLLCSSTGLLTQDVNLVGDFHNGFSRFHVAAHFGLVPLLALWSHEDGWGTPTDYGHTPLMEAVEQGHMEFITHLLERTDIDFSADNKRGDTALTIAIRSWRTEVALMLISRPDISIHSPPKWPSHHPPLYQALEKEQNDIVRAILARPDVDVNHSKEYSLGCEGKSALTASIHLENYEIFDLLLARTDIDINDLHGHCWPVDRPVRVAIRLDLKQYALRLVRDSRISLEEEFMPGFHTCVLSDAIFHEHIELVHLLIDREDVEREEVDDNEMTPLAFAVLIAEPNIVRILLGYQEVSARHRPTVIYHGLRGSEKPLRGEEWSREGPQQSLLSLALQNYRDTYEDCALLLLERPEIDINFPGECGRTALMYAAQRRALRATRASLDREDIDVDIRDDDGKTALDYAVAAEQDEAAGLIREFVGRKRGD